MKQKQFEDIVFLIKQSQFNAIKLVNAELISLYWNVGKYIGERIEKSEWGQSVVKELADYLSLKNSDLKGFSDKNLWRMKQFYETYKNYPELLSLLKEISWTNNLIILSRTKSMKEKEFYLLLSGREKYSSRELERQISSSIFERTMIGNMTLPPSVKALNSDITNYFKDSYVFEFLGLPVSYSEDELKKGLIHQLKNFMLEFGKDFLFVGEEYKIQVGSGDFFVDLVFFHRGLRCLVAMELKSDKFKPEHLGQLNFYLEALDRDIKKPDENPSIGILLCSDKDNDVVEYALNRTLSPAMVSEYKTQLPDKKLLQQKLRELFGSED
ncbi:PDDEXK nuclease domain-containing protein [Methanolapillus millepedarum]